MYLVTMENDDGMWVDDPLGCVDLQEAYVHAGFLASRWKRSAVIYKCEFVTEVDPGQFAEKTDAAS